MVDIPKGYGPDDELDPEAADPLYLQLAAVLISRIQSGVYPLGRSLPGVDRLMQEFGLARGTARKTLVLLAELGYVRTVVGNITLCERLVPPNLGQLIRPHLSSQPVHGCLLLLSRTHGQARRDTTLPRLAPGLLPANAAHSYSLSLESSSARWLGDLGHQNRFPLSRIKCRGSELAGHAVPDCAGITRRPTNPLPVRQPAVLGNVTSTRRFFLRPASEALSAMGYCSP
ncbi:GntR family transcriptional regulator [Streptomyces bobili]|uniref:GntR family transcriptional regulator n=1 Tax=Streptomyces bobili TaxID=67280 RepID=UPI0037937C5E